MGIFKRFKKSNTTSPSEDGDNPQVPPAGDIKQDGDGSNSSDQAGQGNLWRRLQSGLKKTRDVLKTDIRDLFKTDGQLVDDAFLTRLFAILVKTDMGGGPAGKSNLALNHNSKDVSLNLKMS